jgi:hypothetical protein
MGSYVNRSTLPDATAGELAGELAAEDGAPIDGDLLKSMDGERSRFSSFFFLPNNRSVNDFLTGSNGVRSCRDRMGRCNKIRALSNILAPSKPLSPIFLANNVRSDAMVSVGRNDTCSNTNNGGGVTPSRLAYKLSMRL